MLCLSIMRFPINKSIYVHLYHEKTERMLWNDSMKREKNKLEYIHTSMKARFATF
jgi:hypothetical protein